MWPKERNLVLVVDDDAAVRGCVTAMLEAAGFEVIEGTDGRAALTALRKFGESIQVVISDIQMDGIDGVSLFQNAADEFKSLPFVFITGHAESERMVSVPSQFPVITKPFVSEALLACIRRVVIEPASGSKPN